MLKLAKPRSKSRPRPRSRISNRRLSIRTKRTKYK